MKIWWCESHESGIADMGPPDTPQDSVCWTFHHESNIACQLVEMRLVSVDALVIEKELCNGCYGEGVIEGYSCRVCGGGGNVYSAETVERIEKVFRRMGGSVTAVATLDALAHAQVGEPGT